MAKGAQKAPAKTTPAKRSTPPKAAAQPDPKKTLKTQPKPKKRKDRRGTPKGKATRPARNGGKIGNPRFVPTDVQREIVQSHAAVGTVHWLIAEELKISKNTLYRYFSKELDRGLPKLNARIGGLIAKQALAGCTSSQRTWMMGPRGGWSEKQRHEHSGPDGGPIPHSAPINADWSKLSREEKRALEILMRKAAAADENARA